MRSLLRLLFVAAALTVPALALAQPVAAGNGPPPPDIAGGIVVNPTSTLPGTTVQAAGTFTNLGGPADWKIALQLQGTNGFGTFTTVTGGPDTTNCSPDAVARTVTCDWSPTQIQQTTTITATINVPSGASPLPNVWDVFAKQGDETLNIANLTIEATYSGTVAAVCEDNGQPVVSAENTGTGALTLGVEGTGYDLPVGGSVEVLWPIDGNGAFLPAADWQLFIRGTNDVVDSGTLALPNCTPATDPPATDPPATDPPATDPPATDPPATDPPGPSTPPPAGGVDSQNPGGTALPETGAMTWPTLLAALAALAGGVALVRLSGRNGQAK